MTEQRDDIFRKFQQDRGSLLDALRDRPTNTDSATVVWDEVSKQLKVVYEKS